MNEWWGYLHMNGSIQVKRYYDADDLKFALESDFVVRVCGPFDALNRFDAIEIATRNFKP